MDLRFEGDLNIWLGLALALAGAVGIWFIYKKETATRRSGGARRDRFAWLLPWLRAIIIALLLMMLTGPVLRGTTSISDLSRVLIFVDASESMSLTDPTMSQQRKLMSAQQMGLIDTSDSDQQLLDTAEQLAAMQIVDSETHFDERLQKSSRHLYASLDGLSDFERLQTEFESDLIKPLEAMTDAYGSEEINEQQAAEKLSDLNESAHSWQQRLQDQVFAKDESVADAKTAADFDSVSRWHRVESALLTASGAIMPDLIDEHHVELIGLEPKTAAKQEPLVVWQPIGDAELPESLAPLEPHASSTDIASQIRSSIDKMPSTQQLSVVLISDGQHNSRSAEVTSPTQLAKLLGNRNVPIFSIGVGALKPPRDLSILTMQTPESVFADDRVKGQIVVKDNMDEGQPLRIKIEIEGETVWSDSLTTKSAGPRTIDFDFSVKELVEDQLARRVQDVESVSMPLKLAVSIDPLEGEFRDDNNTFESNVRAITRPRRALLIDGRPRWEFRYVRNMLDRDEHWQVDHVLATYDGRRHRLPRGGRGEEFPSDRRRLLGYDLIVLGEVPAGALTAEEIGWLKQFVASRGGGLVLIDGQRGKLQSYASTSLKAALPVRWHSEDEALRNARLSLTERGSSVAALTLESADDATESVWSRLPPMRWVTKVEALPGTETLLEAEAGDAKSPALVIRRYGAGTVLYAAFDESWRWRYEIADLYHQRYWNQVANYVMEPPYAVHNRFASLDTGGFSYQPGEAAALKVRLRDKEGNPVTNTRAEALLYRDENLVATIPLDGGPATGGVLQGNTQTLQPGNYSVGLRADGFTEQQLDLRAEILVSGDGAGELNVLNCNESLLKQMAELSGGAYLREEDAHRLPDLLNPLIEGKDTVTEIALWRSWYLFLPIVGLFTTEWFLRKRLGMM